DAEEFVPERHGPRPCVLDPRLDLDLVVVPRRRVIADLGVGDGEAEPLTLELRVAEAEPGDEVGPSDLTPDQVVRVVDDAHLVRFRVSDPDRGPRSTGWRGVGHLASMCFGRCWRSRSRARLRAHLRS